MAPRAVNKINAKRLLSTVYNHVMLKPVNNKFKVGDTVRISKYKHIF